MTFARSDMNGLGYGSEALVSRAIIELVRSTFHANIQITARRA